MIIELIINNFKLFVTTASIMGGKKKGKGKKGKKKGKGVYDDASKEEQNWILQAEKEALEQKLIVI